MAATQRPATLEALQEHAGERPLWKDLPSWFLIAGQDRKIPAALQHFMAHRAEARRTVELPTASHAVAVSHARRDRAPDPRIRRAAARRRLTLTDRQGSK